MEGYRIEAETKIVSKNGIEFFGQYYETAEGNCPPHIHSSVEMLFITKGSFKVCSENIEAMANEGDLVLFRPNTIHRIYATESNSSYYVLKLHPSLILAISSHEQGAAYLLKLAVFKDGDKIVWSADECRALGILRIMDILLDEYKEEKYGYDIALKTYGLQLLLVVMRSLEDNGYGIVIDEDSNEKLYRRIYDAIIHINKHYAEDITALDCSRELFMSYSYFSRSFKRMTGKSFTDYLVNVRINRAEKALLSSEKPITQIAAECGFNNTAYFSAVYKRLKGQSPSVARRAAGINMPQNIYDL
ncbi:MAG: helix-turn-helix transcriptional regulator [Clostridia bacterium]|nr:helix-turn-helix transcriptional regulator [Clostridia bacterium]